MQKLDPRSYERAFQLIAEIRDRGHCLASTLAMAAVAMLERLCEMIKEMNDCDESNEHAGRACAFHFYTAKGLIALADRRPEYVGPDGFIDANMLASFRRLVSSIEAEKATR